MVALVAIPYRISAQVNISSDNFNYQQNFDVLGSSASPWTDNATIPNWYAANANGTIADYRVSNTGTAALYSYGTNADRAIGSLAALSTGDIIYGVLFQNNSGQTINSIDLSFNAEHWRRPETNVIGYQRMKVSYLIANNIDISNPALYNNTAFIDLPEAYLITLDTVSTLTTTLDGNIYSAPISVYFPVSIPNGSQFFLRFKDENIDNTSDGSLAVDDLDIVFQWATTQRIQATSGYNIFQYLDMGIVMDIPDQDNSPAYTVPTVSQMNDWQIILESFFDDEFLDDVDASAYGYEAVEFVDEIGTSYQVLRKQNYSSFYWGTYVKLINFINHTLTLQAPHASDDRKTGTQAAAVFYLTNCESLFLSGTTRCAGNSSACYGSTTACSNNNTNLPFRESDVAHEVNSIFHLATTAYSTHNPSAVFVQLHGFGQSGSDPDLILSAGTINGYLKSVPDYSVMLREALLESNSSLNIQLPHVDSYHELVGEVNVQGRYLNLYPQDICSGNANVETVTNRFLHIEQFEKYRKFPNHYPSLANALATIINDNAYIKAISINSDPFYYSEDFTSLAYSNMASHTWGNNLHVPGWYAGATVDSLFSIFRISHGQLNTGGIYSFGYENDSDRALGSISTSESASAGNIAYGVLFRNNTGITLYGAELEYKSEQWRDSDQNGIQTVEFGYRIANEIELYPQALLSNNLYTHVSAGDLNSTNLGSGITYLDPPTISDIAITIPFVLNPDQEIFFRFYDADNTGFDKAMAVDNFNVHFLTEPPMPVDWKYFEISKKNGKPLLQWQTDKEDKCSRYEVLRSDDGKNFESIATITCKGKMLDNRYEYLDTNLIWERNVYYKIVQYDHNGDLTISPLRVFNAVPGSKPYVYFQNGELVVETDSESKLLNISVLDFMGRELCMGSPAHNSNSRYSLPCHKGTNQFVVVQLMFDRGNYVTRLKTGY